MQSTVRFGLVLAAALIGCDDSTAPAEPLAASVTIGAADSVLAIGALLDVDVVASDAAGRPIRDAIGIALSTTDSGVVRITGGAVEGIAIGYADVIARAGDAADTLRLRVRDDAVPAAQVRIRFGRGQLAETHGRPGYMRFDDTMGGGPGDVAGLFTLPVDGVRDTMLTIQIPGDAHAGRMALVAFPLDLSDAEGPTALLRFGSPATGDLEYYASVGSGWIELEVDAAPAPGWRLGAARGFFDLPLVKLAPSAGGPPVLTTDTLWLHGNVNVALQHTLSGWAEVELLDGPVVGSSVIGEAFGDDDGNGGWLLGWQADLDGLGSGPARWEVSQELRLLTPAVGSFPMPRFTGPAFGDPSLWPERFSSIFYRDEARIPLVVDGTLTITRWLPATLEDYGAIEGMIDARFELWTPDLTAPTGDTIRALSAFAAPLSPEAGLPATRPAPASRATL